MRTLLVTLFGGCHVSMLHIGYVSCGSPNSDFHLEEGVGGSGLVGRDVGLIFVLHVAEGDLDLLVEGVLILLGHHDLLVVFVQVVVITRLLA